MISTTETRTMIRDNLIWLSQWHTSLLPREWYDDAPPKSSVILHYSDITL